MTLYPTLNGGDELAGDEAEVPPAAVEDLHEGGRYADEGHDEAREAQVRDEHVPGSAVLGAACRKRISIR